MTVLGRDGIQKQREFINPRPAGFQKFRVVQLLAICLVVLSAIVIASVVTVSTAHAQFSPLTAAPHVIYSPHIIRNPENPVPAGLRAALDGRKQSEVSSVRPPDPAKPITNVPSQANTSVRFRFERSTLIGVFALIWMLVGMACVTTVMWRDASGSITGKPVSSRIN